MTAAKKCVFHVYNTKISDNLFHKQQPFAGKELLYLQINQLYFYFYVDSLKLDIFSIFVKFNALYVTCAIYEILLILSFPFKLQTMMRRSQNCACARRSQRSTLNQQQHHQAPAI